MLLHPVDESMEFGGIGGRLSPTRISVMERSFLTPTIRVHSTWPPRLPISSTGRTSFEP